WADCGQRSRRPPSHVTSRAADYQRVRYAQPRGSTRRGHLMKTHFVMMADYNAWANARIFRMAGALADELYRKEVGAYFKSLHGTLNHLLVADRIWMRRLTGMG